ncbi:MAG: sulfurtransferase [Woeseiaceae bacterium]|nr:sulfurtransferase [Woeseiaceae bacterium]
MRRDEILVTADELRQKLAEPSLLILDCRFSLADPKAGSKAFAEGHVPGAGFADLENDLSAELTPDSGRHPLPTPSEAAGAFRRLGVSNDSSVVVYDDSSGAFASRAWWMLRWLGHTDVRLLDGGLAAWKRYGLPLEAGDASAEEGDFAGNARADLIIGSEALGKLDMTSTTLCDAREPDRFLGKAEPIDTIAGHIPGARNTPFSRALDANGRFLETEQLRDLWVEYLDGDLRREWTAMCGSGVTACHLAVSSLLAGASEPRLYAGSWSEWIRNPARPVAGLRSTEE